MRRPEKEGGAGARHAAAPDSISGRTSFSTSQTPTRQDLDSLADRLLIDLIAAGAVAFEVLDDDRWVHDVQPGCRDACRKIKAAADLGRPGFAAAIVRAIRRLRREAAA